MTRALKAVKGVKAARTSFRLGKSFVHADGSICNKGGLIAMKNAILALQYQSRFISMTPVTPKPTKKKKS